LELGVQYGRLVGQEFAGVNIGYSTIF
jgi:hypothetical protein